MSSNSSLSSSLNTHILRLERLLSTTAGLEATLCTLYHTLNLLHTHLTHRLSAHYAKLASSLLTHTTTLTSATLSPLTLTTTILDPEALLTTALLTTALLTTALQTALDTPAPRTQLRTLCTLTARLAYRINILRRILRLPGLLTIYRDGHALRLRGGGSWDPALRGLEWICLGFRAGWQICENGAVISRVASDGAGRRAAWERGWWVWARRWWLAFVIAEGLRLARVRQLRFREELGAEGKEEVVKVESGELRRQWWRQTAANLTWLVYTLDWQVKDVMVEGGEREPTWWSGAGIVPGVLALQDAWRATT